MANNPETRMRLSRVTFLLLVLTENYLEHALSEARDVIIRHNPQELSLP